MKFLSGREVQRAETYSSCATIVMLKFYQTVQYRWDNPGLGAVLLYTDGACSRSMDLAVVV